jgi:hypothetical protein
MLIKGSQKTKNTALQNSYNCFQCTLSHQNYSCNCCNRRTQLKRTHNEGYLRQRSKQMKQQMSCKHVTIKSSSQTNSTKGIANRLKLNKQRSHGPTWTARLEKFYKTQTLSFNSQISNSTKQCNTQSLCKSCLSCNSSTKRYKSKRITYLQ